MPSIDGMFFPILQTELNLMLLCVKCNWYRLTILELWCRACFNLQAAILDSHDPEENQSTKQTDKRMWFVSISESSHITSDPGVSLQMTALCQHLIRQHIFIKEKLGGVTRYHVYDQEMKCSQENGKENSIELKRTMTEAEFYFWWTSVNLALLF